MPPAEALLAFTFWDAQFARWCVWVGLVVLTVALLLLIRTRWGQSQPLGKCVVLSLLVHLLLGIYTTTVQIVSSTVGSPSSSGIQVSLDESAAPVSSVDLSVPDSWTTPADGGGESFADPTELLTSSSTVPDLTAAKNFERTHVEPPLPLVPLSLPEPSPGEEVAPPADPMMSPLKSVVRDAEPIEMPSATAAREPDPVPPPAATAAAAATSTAPSGGMNREAEADSPAPPVPLAGAGGPAQGAGALPEAMQQRMGDHLKGGRAFGATQESEAAVQASLRWLAANQRPSGRWDARELGGGAGRAADGQDRQAAGLQADTGLTGLALLAFLAGGHTHLQGQHQSTVRRGLEFLLGAQDTDGCLGGAGNRYERMYCHAMATCALSEAYAMSRDKRLQSGLHRAIDYTLRSQDRTTGGWRYQPNEAGDTSQLGWQLMALKSAELGGMAMPAETREGMARFIRSVSSGRNGGLACYQPTRPVATRSMTAEAMVCRQFLGLPIQAETAHEASNFVLQEMPGSGQTNHYYWYYATLALYQLQGDPWQRWNQALQKSLLGSQRQDGGNAGSWDPDPVWGGCGGRVYSTALATLCLEVYYRYLPLYVAVERREKRTK
jgi:hypothetical protein